MKHNARSGAIALATLLALAAGARAAGPTDHVVVDGGVATPGSYDLARLDTLAQVTQTDTFTSAGSPQTHVYSGASLWGVLNDAGIVVNPAVKNDVLDKIVVAQGSDGYKSVFALGELSPSFGHLASIVATSETIAGTTAPLGADGFARVTAPGDGKGGRYVSNLASLTVESAASTQGATTRLPTTSFDVRGAVGHEASFDLAALEALPSVTETVGADTYTGVSLWSLLNSTVGLDTDPSIKNDVLGMYIVATGSDGYEAVLSMGELDADFGDQPDLVAFEDNGAPLGSTGFARLVLPDDVKAGRWVSNLVSLEVFDVNAVPEPANIVLMLAGLAVVGAAARRRALNVSRAAT